MENVGILLSQCEVQKNKIQKIQVMILYPINFVFQQAVTKEINIAQTLSLIYLLTTTRKQG